MFKNHIKFVKTKRLLQIQFNLLLKDQSQAGGQTPLLLYNPFTTQPGCRAFPTPPAFPKSPCLAPTTP